MAVIREELILYDRFTNTFTEFIRLGERAAGATQQARKSVDRFTDSQKRAAAASDSLSGSLKRLVGTYLSFQGVKSLLGLSDQITATDARLKLMTGSEEAAAAAQEEIYAAALRSRGAYTDMAATVAKLGTLAGNAFGGTGELVAFAEQLNKQMALSGTTTAEAQAAMLQLTQGLASGVLRGEELNSVLEQTPMVAQTIAKYMGVSVGEMRELASQGKVTADVVKNAVLGAAEETNAAFEQMPYTWAQVWTMGQNIILQTFQPVLNAVGRFADLLSRHMDTAIAVFYGLAAAVAFYTAAQWLATGAAKAFFATLAAHPALLALAVAIGVVVAAIARWVQAVGGLKIAWMIAVDKALYGWDVVKAGFQLGVMLVTNWLENLGLTFKRVGTALQNYMGAAKVGVLTILQTMVNGAIDIINWFIVKLNKIPGVSIEAVEHVTFAATAAAAEDAARANREAALLAAERDVAARQARRAQELSDRFAEADANHAARQAEIEKARAEMAAGAGQPFSPEAPIYQPVVQDIAADVSAIRKSVDMSQEDLKMLVEQSERRYVNRINLTSQTPVINISGQNTGRTAADRQSLANAIRDILIEQTAAGSVISTAVPVVG